MTSWKTRTWPSHEGPAPIPIVGTGIVRVISAARPSGTHSSTIAKHPAGGRGAAVLEDLLRRVGVAPRAFDPAELAVGLGRQPEVAHDGDVGRENGFDRREDPPSPLDLDGRAARLRQEASGVADRVGHVRLVREKWHG